MKSAIEKMVEWLNENHPTAVPGEEVIHHLKRVEQMNEQMAYNQGFTKAKSIYLDAEWSTLKAVYKSIVLSGFGWHIANMQTIWFMFPTEDHGICERPKG